jgi:hypothetical protein
MLCVFKQGCVLGIRWNSLNLDLSSRRQSRQRIQNMPEPEQPSGPRTLNSTTGPRKTRKKGFSPDHSLSVLRGNIMGLVHIDDRLLLRRCCSVIGLQHE